MARSYSMTVPAISRRRRALNRLRTQIEVDRQWLEGKYDKVRPEVTEGRKAALDKKLKEAETLESRIV